MKCFQKSIFLISLIALSVSATTYNFHTLNIDDPLRQNTEICFECHIPSSKLDSSTWMQPKEFIDGTVHNYYDILGTPDSFSKSCLLCHDGGAKALALNAPVSPCGIKSKPTGREHPIFISYPLRSDFNNPATLLGEVWRDASNVSDLLRENKVVCMSCHTAHNSEGTGYLRTYNTSSILCLGCHNK